MVLMAFRGFGGSRKTLVGLVTAGILLSNYGYAEKSIVNELTDKLKSDGRKYALNCAGIREVWTKKYSIDGVEYRASLLMKEDDELSLHLDFGNGLLKKKIFVDNNADGKLDMYLLNMKAEEINENVCREYEEVARKILDQIKKDGPIRFPSDLPRGCFGV